MKARVLVATRNLGKLKEYRALLSDLQVALVSLADLAVEQEVEETGDSFTANATMKATEYSRITGLLTVADDSGLEVDALGGQPGVKSARYGGAESDDRGRIQLLLDNMRAVPWEKRTARFRAAVAIASPGGQLDVFEGTCEGMIAFEATGTQGFGYDPVFFVPSLGKSMSQLPLEVKNQISHRSRAMQNAKDALVRLAEQNQSSQAESPAEQL